MPTIQLKAMTRELCHELYKHWTNDASIYMDMHLFQPYVYDEAAVNADTIRKNTRSQNVLEKVGFRFVGEDEAFKYYRIEQ